MFACAPSLRAVRKHTGLLVFDLHALLCGDETQRFPPVPVQCVTAMAADGGGVTGGVTRGQD